MEKIEQYKQSWVKFIVSEFIVFLSQIAVFFMVAVFTSNFLNSEEKLVAFSKQKINDGSLTEIGLTFLAILVVIGFFTTLGRIFDNKNVDYFVNEVLYEMPKTIYFFGSAVTGVMLAISLFMFLNPTPEASPQGFGLLTLFFALMVFLYGCGFSYAFKHKTHIKKNLTKKTENSLERHFFTYTKNSPFKLSRISVVRNACKDRNMYASKIKIRGLRNRL